MRVARVVFSILLIVLSSPRLNSQQSVATPQRDPQATALANQTVAAAGWSPTLVPATILASGTLTRTNGDVQQVESFTLKQRGASQHRLDIVDSGATASTIVNGLAGIILFADGTKHRLPPPVAISMQSPIFPFLSDLAKTADLDVDVQDLGADTIDGIPCRGISIGRHAKSDDKLAQFRDLAAPLKIWLSQKSGLPVRIDFIRLADDNPYLPMHFSRSFSDYRVVNGVAIAFTQEERFEGQLMYRFQFIDVRFNSALTDAEFDTSKL